MKNFPEDLYDIFKRFAEKLEYNVSEARSHNSGNVIHICEKVIPNRPGKVKDMTGQNGLLATIQHEIGHFIDRKLAEERGSWGALDFYSHIFSQISSAADKDLASRSLVWGELQPDGSYPSKREKVLELCGSEKALYHDKMLFSDLFDNLLSGVNELKWKHGEDYYGTGADRAIKAHRRPSELFANLTAIYARQNKQEIAFVEDYMPETWAAYLEVIKEGAKNGSDAIF